MNALVAGQILEDAHNIGEHVYASLVVDPDARHPVMREGYRVRGIFCPACSDEVSTGSRAYCAYHNRECYCFYCPNCWLLFENILIGHLDEEGDYHEDVH